MSPKSAFPLGARPADDLRNGGLWALGDVSCTLGAAGSQSPIDCTDRAGLTHEKNSGYRAVRFLRFLPLTLQNFSI